MYLIYEHKQVLLLDEQRQITARASNDLLLGISVLIKLWLIKIRLVARWSDILTQFSLLTSHVIVIIGANLF